MAAHIGSVTYTYPLKWINKNVPVTLGSDVRTRSGNLVMLRPVNVSQDYICAKLVFEWVPMSDVATLYSYWKSGNSYSANLENSGGSVTVRFAAKDGVANVKHQAWGDDVVHAQIEGDILDLYTGELNLIIETEN